MAARWAAFGVWLVVAAAALFWGLRLFSSAPSVPPSAVVAGGTGPPSADLSRVLGADAPRPVAESAPPPPPEAARFQLIGVVSPRGSGVGVALIAVDGQPPRAYRVGARIDGETLLRSVSLRSARLGPAGVDPVITLELPPPAPAATGTLASLAAAPGAVQPGFVLPPQPGQPRPPNGPVPLRAPGALPQGYARPSAPLPAQVPTMPGAAPVQVEPAAGSEAERRERQ